MTCASGASPPRNAGTFVGAVQRSPSTELATTMLLAAQSGSKRQSLQAAQILPSPATSAETNGGTRRPVTSSVASGATRVGPGKVAPRSDERTVAISSIPARSEAQTL